METKIPKKDAVMYTSKWPALIIILLILTGCGTSRPKTSRPDADTVKGKIPVADAFAHHKSDFACAKIFKEVMGDVKRISVKYRLSPESDYTRQEVLSSHWNREIEKGLIRLGFIIVNDYRKDPMALLGEPHNDVKCDATMVIDRVMVKKVPAHMPATADGIPGVSETYRYNYFISEINGSLILRNRDVVWSGSIIATSFDLFRLRNGLKDPVVEVHANREYRFSERLNKWVHGQWEMKLGDNFSRFYDSPLKEDYVSRELIRYTVAQLFATLGE